MDSCTSESGISGPAGQSHTLISLVTAAIHAGHKGSPRDRRRPRDGELVADHELA
ncbi:hypothetical protein H7H53_03145 [Mycobacterium lacus]|nr:hypothetical protein [Mycobacterium lacus]